VKEEMAKKVELSPFCTKKIVIIMVKAGLEPAASSYQCFPL
jgi:hypothetical protein